MNIRFVISRLGLLMVVLGVIMILLAGADALFWTQHQGGLVALVVSAAMSLGLGGAMWYLGRRGKDRFLGRREAMLLVASTWLLGAALGALPFWIWAVFYSSPDQPHVFRSFVACYFEAMSGLTTTGSSVLSDIEAMPKSMLLWRSSMHWLGGLGIVVLFVAVLPTLGVGGRRLFQYESSAKSLDAEPRIRHTARQLWLVYLGLTLVQVFLMRAYGLEWFDAICETFGTMASGGFSTRNASIGAYGSLAVELTVILFMVLTGINFGLYLQLLHGRWRIVLRDPELRLYLFTTLAGVVIVTIAIVNRTIITTSGDTVQGTLGSALRYGAFNLISIRTNTGFATADFDQWGFLAKATLLALMFMGGSAGSTSGGVKVLRCLIVLRVLAAEIERVFRPNVVRPIKIGGTTIEPEVRLEMAVFIMAFVGLFFLASVLIMLIEPRGSIDYVSAASACAATINTTGPGYGLVGPTSHFGNLSTPSLGLLSILMALGRLEIYAIIVLLLPGYWKGD